MHLSQAIKRWMAVIVFIVLALSFYRFRWGILGLVNIGPPSQACESMEVLDAYLSTGGDPEAYLDRTPLIMCATERGSYEIVSRLIDLGVDIDAQKKRPLLPLIDSSTGTTALYVSVIEENLDITKLLFENGADINIDTTPGSTSPLNLAVRLDLPEFLRLFLEDNDTVHEFDDAWIYDAAYDGDVEIFRALFEADIHLGEIYESVLAGAAYRGRIEVVKFLYTQGIAIDSKSIFSGQTALHLSVRSEHMDIINFLISIGADVNTIDDKGNTSLHYAAISNNAEIAKILVDSGADTNAINHDGETPFEAAVSHDSLDVVNMFKQHERVSP